MLSPARVAAAKAKGRAYKLADERGMYLLVGADGSRRWRFDYRRPSSGKRNTLSLGIYPDGKPEESARASRCCPRATG